MAWYRCCYKHPSWRPGLCKWPDGYAREHWRSSREAAEQSAKAAEAHGCETFVESREFA